MMWGLFLYCTTRKRRVEEGPVGDLFADIRSAAAPDSARILPLIAARELVTQ